MVLEVKDLYRIDLAPDEMLLIRMPVPNAETIHAAAEALKDTVLAGRVLLVDESAEVHVVKVHPEIMLGNPDA
jgi:hypothetical protein